MFLFKTAAFTTRNVSKSLWRPSVLRNNSTNSKLNAEKDINSVDQMIKSIKENKSSGLSFSASESSIIHNPYEFATKHIIQDKLAGRSVIVARGEIDRAISRLDILVKTNKLREINFSQRFFIKPNKKRLAKKVANRKRVFENGIAKLFSVVKDAVRKGY